MKRRRPNRFLAGLALALWFLGPAGSALAQAPPNTLVQMAIGADADYTRLVFTFEKPLADYVLRRDDVNTLTVDFGRAGLSPIPPLAPDKVVNHVALAQEEGRLVATVELGANRNELRHFTSRDRYSCIIDIKNLDAVTVEDRPENDQDMEPVDIPGLAETARMARMVLPEGVASEPADVLFTQILDELEADAFDPALKNLQRFEERYPSAPQAETAAFLLAETQAALTPLADHFTAATAAWQEALEKYPQSLLAPRAAYLLAQANADAGQRNEAAALFKLAADTYPDSRYAGPALLKAADINLNMGLFNETRALLEPLTARGLSDYLGLAARARLGMADFLSGLYSQANETFREVLDHSPEFYETYPEILYATGEGYHYLKRPDLARIFLLHAVNLMPDHPKVDVMMARIGDAYRQDRQDKNAMAIYAATARRFPNGDGGLVSQMRLAEMGALHAFFKTNQVFTALERGSRQGTVEMYEKIVDSGSASPLLQLAYLKIGQAAAEDGNNAEAIKWLRDLAITYPKSTLLPEAAPTLSRALVHEAELRRALDDWNAVSDLYADNSSYIQEADQLQMRRLLAEAYEKQGRYEEARDTWKSLEEREPDKRLVRGRSLVLDSLKLGQPLEALGYLLELAPEFPEERDWIEIQLDQVGLDLARAGDAQALAGLLHFREQIASPPLRRRALADAVTIAANIKDDQQALRLMDDYVKEYPDDELSPEYRLAQAQIDKRQKQPDQAWSRLADFRLAYPDDPRGPQTLLEQIEEADQLNRPDDALRFMDLYRGAYPQDPRGRDLLLERLDRERRMGRHDDAERSLFTFAQDYPDDQRLPDLLLQQADLEWAEGRQPQYQRIVDLFRQQFPGDSRAAGTYLDAYRKSAAAGDYDQAFAIADQFKAANPEPSPVEADLMLEQARDLFTVGRPAEGLELWSRFRQTFPDDPRTPDLLLIQARQEYKEGQTDTALGHYHEFLEKYPDNPKAADVTLELAAAETKAGHLPEASDLLADFRRRFANHPQVSKVFLDQIALNTTLGRTEANIGLYQEFRRQYPDSPETPRTFMAQAQLERAAGRVPAAIETLEEGLLENPDLGRDPAVTGLLADLYLDDGQVENWAAMMERTLNDDPNPAGNLPDRFFKYNQLAQIYMELGMTGEAERDYDAALANRPPDASPETIYAIAGAYKKLQRQEKYIQTLQLVRDSGDPFWQKAAAEELSSVQTEAPPETPPQP